MDSLELQLTSSIKELFLENNLKGNFSMNEIMEKSSLQSFDYV